MSLTPRRSPAAGSVRSVERAIDLLSVLENADHPMGVTELARATAMPKATTQRLLTVLEGRGLVQKEQGRYQMGVGVVPMAHAFLLGSNLTRAALPVLQELAQATDETAALYVRHGFHRVVVHRVEGPNPLRYAMPIGQRLPLHLGAAGLVLAAAMQDDELQAMLHRLGEMQMADGRSLTREELAAKLQRARQQGFTVARDERTMGVASVAAAVVRPGKPTLAAIAVTGPPYRMGEEKIEQVSIEVRRAAQAIAARYNCP